MSDSVEKTSFWDSDLIIKKRVKESVFYNRYLFLSDDATILPVITEHVRYISGCDMNGKPSAFLCCLVRMLELMPLKEVIDLYLVQFELRLFKYLVALLLVYVRIAWKSASVYQTLEPYYGDYRKLIFKIKMPKLKEDRYTCYELTFMDEWVDRLLREDYVVDVFLPMLSPRQKLVENGSIAPKKYFLDLEEFLSSEPDQTNSESDSE